MVHAQAGRLLEEGEHHLALAEAVDHHGRGAEVHAVGGHPHQVRRHPVELGHQHADPRRPAAAAPRPSSASVAKREDQLVVQRREVVHAGHVGGALDVGQLLARLLHAGVQVADDRLGAQHRLAVELEHEPQHAVGRGVLGPHVDDHRLVVAALDVDVARVDVAALGQAQDGAHLLAQLAGRRGAAGRELLGALRGLGDEGPLLGRQVGGLGRLEAQLLGRRLGPDSASRRRSPVLVLVLVLGHRGPGASLNCTGTRPTP